MSRLIELIGDGFITGLVRAVLLLIVIGGFGALIWTRIHEPFQELKRRS